MTLADPTVSIVMPAYNAAATIGGAIRSTLAQTFTDFELIIVDDCSTDNTAAVVQSFADPRLVLIRNPRNYKLAKSLNIGIGAAKGRYIARLDADDLNLPERLANQVAFLESHPEIDLVGSCAYIFDDRGTIIGTLTFPTDHEAIVGNILSISLLHSTLMGRAVWFRRFPYAEEYTRAQDRELFLRSYRFSRFANLPQFLYAYHDPGKISLPKLIRSLWYNAYMIAKNWRQYYIPVDKVLYFLLIKIPGRMMYYLLSAAMGKNIFWAHIKNPKLSADLQRDSTIIRGFLKD